MLDSNQILLTFSPFVLFSRSVVVSDCGFLSSVSMSEPFTTSSKDYKKLFKLSAKYFFLSSKNKVLAAKDETGERQSQQTDTIDSKQEDRQTAIILGGRDHLH